MIGKSKDQDMGSPQEKILSESFTSLIESDETFKALLEGCHVTVTPWDKKVAYEDWEKTRRFIADAIDRDGSILDYGCANGFLLRSLQEWSGHELVPYGFDIDPKGIEEARGLFPEQKEHFISPEDRRRGADLPKEFDFVYWNVWDNWEFDKQEGLELLEKLEAETKKGGRLILGFYGSKEANLTKIAQLEKLGYVPNRTLESQDNGEQIIVWFDKS
jgi:SAM-dependent methyltransferase